MNTIYEWLEEACKPLRYKPDREAAYRELKNHYDDHKEYLTDGGTGPAAAEWTALKAMGDPADTARMLSAAYRPMLTFLWRLSRVVLIILVITAIIAGVFGGSHYSQWTFSSAPEEAILNSMAFYTNRDENTRLTPGFCTDTVTLGEYKFSVTKALKCTAKDLYEPERYNHFAVIILKAAGPVWLDASREICAYMSARDDSGDSYINNWERIIYSADEKVLTMQTRPKNWGFGYYSIFVSNTDPDIQWLDLSYDHRGDSFSLRIVFDKEADE